MHYVCKPKDPSTRILDNAGIKIIFDITKLTKFPNPSTSYIFYFNQVVLQSSLVENRKIVYYKKILAYIYQYPTISEKLYTLIYRSPAQYTKQTIPFSEMGKLSRTDSYCDLSSFGDEAPLEWLVSQPSIEFFAE